MTEWRLWFNPAFRHSLEGRNLLCLVDGEHYPPVVKSTVQRLEDLSSRVVALVFIGGTEKVEHAAEELAEAAPRATIYPRDGEAGGRLDLLQKALDETDAEAVVDLSDEPVVDYGGRFRLASRTLLNRVPYISADFAFTPPPMLDVLTKPSLSVIGTGKRVGKTAVGVSLARLLKHEGWNPVVVCMGRGGPAEPDYVNTEEMTLDADTLLDVAERGGHAASDYWEDALLSRVPTVGCRRCGGGMAGTPVAGNVVAGAQVAEKTPHEFVIMEGSGATFAPVRTDCRIVVVGGGQPLQNVVGYLGEYRLLTSDLAIVTMCEQPIAGPEKVEALKNGILDINPDIDLALTVFRPEPLGSVEGERVFLATTAPREVAQDIAGSLEEEYDCEVAGISTNLSRRPALREELHEGLEDCTVLLTEIKAASIDVAARAAKAKGARIVFLHNRLELVGGTVQDFDEAVLDLCRSAVS